MANIFINFTNEQKPFWQVVLYIWNAIKWLELFPIWIANIFVVETSIMQSHMHNMNSCSDPV